jgi:hypothetical protein
LTIEFEVIDYLERTPCARLTEDKMKQRLTRWSQLPLTKLERVQLINWLPENLDELQTIIENYEARFSSSDSLSLLLEPRRQEQPGVIAQQECGAQIGRAGLS